VWVSTWQDNASLKWSDADIASVARHLNNTIYHFPQTTDRLSKEYNSTNQSVRVGPAF